MRRVLSIACLLVACSSAHPASETTAPSGTTDSSPVASSTQVGPTTSAVGSTVTTSTTVAVIDNDPFFPGLELTVISLLTPTSGAGARPMLSWEPVAGAVSYTVLVMDAEGEPWWSWSGTETEAVLGGVATDAEIGGPVAGDGISWVVFGFDSEDALVAASPRRAFEE